MECDALLREIGDSVQARRREIGLTQKQLASMANVSDRSVRSLEAGKARGIGLENLIAILAPLGMSLSFNDGGLHRKLTDGSRRPLDPQEEEYESLLRYAVTSWQEEGEAHGR